MLACSYGKKPTTRRARSQYRKSQRKEHGKVDPQGWPAPNTEKSRPVPSKESAKKKSTAKLVHKVGLLLIGKEQKKAYGKGVGYPGGASIGWPAAPNRERVKTSIRRGASQPYGWPAPNRERKKQSTWQGGVLEYVHTSTDLFLIRKRAHHRACLLLIVYIHSADLFLVVRKGASQPWGWPAPNRERGCSRK